MNSKLGDVSATDDHPQDFSRTYRAKPTANFESLAAHVQVDMIASSSGVAHLKNAGRNLPSLLAAQVKTFWKPVFCLPFLLLAFFLSQDMCLWSAPRMLHLPSLILLSAGIVVFFAILAAIPLSLYFAVRASLNWQDRASALNFLCRSLFCVLFAASFIGILHLNDGRRTDAFRRASFNGAPIVAALNAYHLDNGNYPVSLEQLTPEYVAALPNTGLIGYPEFQYRQGYNDISAVPNSYELRINCASGGINFDRFIYWPSERYPEQIQGNWTEPIGSWVYVHE